MGDRSDSSVAVSRSVDVRGASRKSTGKVKGITKQLPWRVFFQVVVCFLLLIAMIASVPLLLNWLNRPIIRVEVHSSFVHLSSEKVKDVLRPLLSERFFALDLKAMKKDLLSIEWVREVSVRRLWPDRVQIVLEEQHPVAKWGNTSLISNEGELFDPEDMTEFSAMPVLNGPQGMAPEVMQQYLSISQLLRPMGLKLTRLERGNNGSWRFTVGHVEVTLGRDRRMERLQRFVRFYHAKLESSWKRVKRVDLRYLNGISVAWHETDIQDRSK